MNRDGLIERLREVLADKPEISLAYLFGLQVDGTTGPMSDVDVGIVVEGGTQGDELRSFLAHKLGRQIQPVSVDVVLLARAPIELAYAAIAQGMCIFQRDTYTRVECEANLMSRYGDYLPVMQAQKRAILEEDANDRRVQRYREAFRRTEQTLEQIRAAEE